MDTAAAYRALKTKDARFDGRLFVGVLSTGIYCRPVCPANTPKAANCRFYPSAAAAQDAGFRPCLRCRPENAPAWAGTSKTVTRGLALIAEGACDDGVEALAERLGMGERQLRRLFKQHLGTTPIAVAQTRRVLFAKQLIAETAMPLSDVAFAAGFGSVRRFNETFQQLFQRPPSALRRPGEQTSAVTLQLPYRPPYDWEAMLTWWSLRAIPGVEQVSDGVYTRVIAHGTITIAHDPARHCLRASIALDNVRTLGPLVARIRQVFDLGADVAAINAHLAEDRMLRAPVKQRPGLRVPGGWDSFEVAVRAVLGQQVTVGAAHKLLLKLVQISGSRGFPSAAEVRAADIASLPMPKARQRTLRAIAEAAPFITVTSLDANIAQLRAIPGVGDWTAHYIALRAFREPDAFPAADAGLMRAAGLDAAALEKRAERWRPWRAYAAQHLWSMT